MTKRRATTRSRQGIFITLEGIEGSGKSTQLGRLGKSLRERGYHVLETREPGGTPLAERMRALLLAVPSERTAIAPHVSEQVTGECEAALIFAARSQHVAQVIEPALRQGIVVLCDRFFDSTIAYQGYARGLDVQQLRTMNRFVTKGLSPDMTLLFDLPVAVGLGRRRRQGTEQNRLDRETRRFHERVREGFLELAARYPRRIQRFDARPDPDLIAARVVSAIEPLLSRGHGLLKA